MPTKVLLRDRGIAFFKARVSFASHDVFSLSFGSFQASGNLWKSFISTVFRKCPEMPEKFREEKMK